MTMSLASCLPDFGTDEDLDSHVRNLGETPLLSPATFRQATPTKSLAEASHPPKVKLQSVVRQIKLVENSTVSSVAEPPPAIDIEALLKTHGEKVREEETKKAQAAIAEALANERKMFEEQLITARASWIAEESNVLAKRLAGSLSEIEDNLSRRITQIFTPFLKEAIREKAIESLEKTTMLLLQESNHAKIEISGPEDLVTAIKDSIENHSLTNAPQIEVTFSDVPDVRIAINDKVCMTQLSTWNSLIEEALSGK